MCVVSAHLSVYLKLFFFLSLKLLEKNEVLGFPGSPVTKTLSSQSREPEFNSWLGNLIPHAATKTQHS